MSRQVTYREGILGQFDPEVAGALIEFSKELAAHESDALIFMARSSLCLHDVLQAVGAPPCEQLILSDRVLDGDLSALSGKRITLVDDTLIVGTTLARTLRQLEGVGCAGTETWAFMRDRDFAVDELLVADHVALDRDDQQTKNFSAAEVRAFSITPRPYLVDFPVLRHLRLAIEDLTLLLSAGRWTARDISSVLQRQHNVGNWTFFPTAGVLDDLQAALTPALADLLELTKVRLFARRVDDVLWCQIVPLATIRPVHEDALGQALSALLRHLKVEDSMRDGLLHSFQAPRGRFRLVQYLFSAALGQRFIADLRSSVGDLPPVEFDQAEADRHFGPWTRPLVSAALTASAEPGELTAAGERQTRAAPRIPARIEKGAQEILRGAASTRPDPPNGEPPPADRLMTDFCAVFLSMFDLREEPARREAARLGARIFDADATEAPNRDRLDTGVPWGALLAWICSRYRVAVDSESANTVSLMLDVCNDAGIAVPIIAERDGVVLRAYRHGEGVKVQDGEPDLAHYAVEGYLNGAERQTIDRLSLEKLLVLLMHAGATKGFLTPLYNDVSAPGAVKIKFNLKGAVAKIHVGPPGRDDSVKWLSTYLVERSILIEGSDRSYRPGRRVGGAFSRDDAPQQARQLGTVVGMLARPPGPQEPQWRLRPERELTVLASCVPPRHAATAVQVELDIFRSDWQRRIKGLLDRARPQPTRAAAALRDLINTDGYEALQSARMKYIGYRRGEPRAIVDAGVQRLRATQPPFGDVLADMWEGWWTTLESEDAAHEARMIAEPLDRAAVALWDLTVATLLAEIALSSAALQLESTPEMTQRLVRAWSKFDACQDDFGEMGLTASPITRRATKRLEELRVAGQVVSEPAAAISYARRLATEGLTRASRSIDEIGSLVEQFGQLAARHDFRLLLWYDIVDSTGTEAAKDPHVDLTAYLQQVGRFQDLLNRRLNEAALDARRQQAEVFSWNGTLDSNNDEKHIFLAGRFATRHMHRLLDEIAGALATHPEVRLRMLLAPCDFVGTSVVRFGRSTELQGKDFWQHLSRLRPQLRRAEAETRDDADSFLAVVDKRPLAGFAAPESLRWKDPRDRSMTTTIEPVTHSTSIRFGALAPRPATSVAEA